MVAQVTLKITSGSLQGQQFIFDSIITTLIGRHPDCHPRLPEDDSSVSRYHCILDINPIAHPPQIQIRDYGSKTGTKLNGQIIGQRQPNQNPQESAKNKYLFHPLKTGDQITIGNTTIQVSVEIISQQNSIPPKLLISSINQAFSDNHSPETPPEIPGYQIHHELGRGGFGVVYFAHHQDTDQPVALKIIRPDNQANQSTRKTFLREIKITQSFNHHNIVKVLDFGEQENLLFLSLEYCSSGTVSQQLKKQGKFSLETALHITHQTLDALAYAHTLDLPPISLPDGRIKTVKGIVHRDIKPSNLLCVSDGNQPTIKIADFGLAKAFDLAGLSSSFHTADNSNPENPSVAGTYAFMPKQQVLDFKYAKPEVDVWAVAACLYQMLTGRVPRDFSQFSGSSSDAWRVVLESPTLPIRQYNALIPVNLAKVIDCALHDHSKLHFKTAQEFKQALLESL